MRPLSILLAAALMSPLIGSGQSYPDRPLRMIVPFPPGGSTDTYARIVSRRLAEILGQQIVIDNRPGAGGALGAELAAKAPADGYTLWIGQDGNLALGPAMRSHTPYDALHDFAPISLLVTTPEVMVVNDTSPIATLKDLVAAARKAPGTLTYASAGVGTTGHVLGAFFNQAAGVQITHIAYKGAAPALVDLRGGRINYLATSVPSAVQFIRDGKLKPLATTDLTRARVLPDVPTVAESGYPNFRTLIWHGMLAPARTPEAVVARLNREIGATLAQAEVRKLLMQEGGDLRPGTPQAFAAFLAAEVPRWAQIIRQAGITAE